jgi:hypothetical protein
LGTDVVLLDTQANISIFHPSVLENVEAREREIKINGIRGYQLTVRDKGFLPNFFEVFCSPDVRVNGICFEEVEDLFKVEYKEYEGFLVHLLDGKEILFKGRNKMFVADVVNVAPVLTTIAEKKTQYLTEEVKRAEVAYELLRNAGYPSWRTDKFGRRWEYFRHTHFDQR